MNLIFSLLLLLPFGISQQNDLIDGISNGNTGEWVITQQTTKADLDKIVSEVAEKGGELFIHKATYEEYLLISLEVTLATAIGKVDYKNDWIVADTKICLRIEKSEVSVGCCTEK